ncbi:nuclease-related domain-containing protein [Nocardia sp. NPDC050406]|uniref:nuclease-related domain-containing protein n=1 Tax=Nocardia sp. NPDC050406 TaxID=3364318 RepID=UPI0037BD63FB
MLVVNERTDAPKTERLVADWLRKCRVPGIAVAGAHIPGRHRRDAAQEADFIVFTPNSCVCIEVKGTLSPSGGTLSCPVNGSWSMSGYEGDPVHVRSGDVNPVNQAKSAMYAVKALTKNATGAEQFVSALVVIVPRFGTTVTLDKPTRRFMPKGVDIMLGGRPNDLFTWFQRGTYHQQVWTVPRVQVMLRELGINDPATTPDALASEGFTDSIENSKTIRRTPAPVFADPWSEPVADPMPSLVQDAEIDPPRYLPSRPISPVAPERYESARPSRSTRTRRRGSLGLLVFAIIAVIVLGGGIWYLITAYRSQPAPVAPSMTRSVVDTSAGLPSQAETLEQPVAPSTNFQGPQPCYPFQPDC